MGSLMGKKKKKSGSQQDEVMRVLGQDPVIIPQDGAYDEETPLPDRANPWPAAAFVIGLVILFLIWRHFPDLMRLPPFHP